MVFKAVAAYNEDVEQLKEAVIRILRSRDNNQIPPSVTTPREKVECIFYLAAQEYPDFERDVFETFSLIMKFAEITRIFAGNENKRFCHSYHESLLKIQINNYDLCVILYFFITDFYST